MHEVNVAEYSKFIFQSGDILMMDFKGYILRLFLIYIPIWWYSNFSSFVVITQSTAIYIPIWWYSNYSVLAVILCFVIFTFQSGDIQIFILSNSLFLHFKIYIPIWWYSNQDRQCCLVSALPWFTFQSGDIQIKTARL